MLLKYVVGLGTLPVLVGVNQRWTVRQIVGAVATAIVPYTTIPFVRRLERRGLLDGERHLNATDDPRDQAWTRRFLRWMLWHPVALLVTFVVGIAVIMTSLLIIGHP